MRPLTPKGRSDGWGEPAGREIEALVRAAPPALVELHGVGVEIAGQFLVTAGDNADRIRNEAAFAKLCGVVPQPMAVFSRLCRCHDA